ncbi:phage baseplate assembly protein V [Cupriavidus taiwanensis]|uniref:phage baseplate assembly protein V n=1 Tax=Cupriavidus taiwanensis TaxID=164546 RepID=UPI000E104A45|nr:phage baseplate assembly protein V [Cupriavidus taiwanensis]SOY56863.1 putative Phage baseplate assembly protein V [Cupriavidus taiwanensis]SOY90807.1 putative Phage baseplate assembly protein V [Cupriavidus taiwanensis]SOZ63593.1 putative Phage baseplate assembly protein V [Cupriavidus taiwanensis]SOZ82616.1 putative Phage baseplate assembly protein V [Cupriavidus taiwanensis]SOZ84455.1 putative Phage baseplate assembly protein V [Cupriavidus taiwanensis]
MMQAIRNQMAMAAQLARGDVAESRAGIVRSYDPDRAAARVEFVDRSNTSDDEALFISGWLPVTSPWVGNGWGMDAPPSPGDQVEVKFFGGSVENGYVCGRLYSDADRPPGAPSGEFWVVHKSGSSLKFKNDGTVEVVAHTTAKYTAQLHHFIGPVQMDDTLLVEDTITGQGGMAVTGDNGTGKSMSISGDTQFAGQVSANGKRIDDTHGHSGVQSGGSNTGPVV